MKITRDGIEIKENGVFAGTPIGVEALTWVDGQSVFAFGPDERTARARLEEKLAALVEPEEEEEAQSERGLLLDEGRSDGQGESYAERNI